MMANVPNATVIITNPTHFAVALKYDRDMAAPKCVAKGADAVALVKASSVIVAVAPPLVSLSRPPPNAAVLPTIVAYVTVLSKPLPFW